MFVYTCMYSFMFAKWLVLWTDLTKDWYIWEEFWNVHLLITWVWLSTPLGSCPLPPPPPPSPFFSNLPSPVEECICTTKEDSFVLLLLCCLFFCLGGEVGESFCKGMKCLAQWHYCVYLASAVVWPQWCHLRKVMLSVKIGPFWSKNRAIWKRTVWTKRGPCGPKEGHLE